MVVPRSYLFAPATHPDRFEKARASGAHAVIIDLEDAVAAADKSSARDAIANHTQPGDGYLVRVNGVGTAEFEEDIRVCEMTGVAAVVLPKAEQVDELRELWLRLQRPVLPLIESARGMASVESIAGQGGVQRLLLGSVDLQLDLGMDAEEDDLVWFRNQLVMASRLAEIAAPVDGVTVALGEGAPIERDAKRAKQLGFGGKLCIHPTQVAVVNRVFRPSEADIDWANAILDAAGDGRAAVVNGEIVDKPMVTRAERILDESR